MTNRTAPDPAADALEVLVLVLAPLGRGGALEGAGLACTVAAEADLPGALRRGVGVLLLTEEALTPVTRGVLTRATETQPDWSDLPLVLLLNPSGQPGQKLAPGLGDAATVLERPTRAATLVTVVRAALKARRQYQVRDLLREQEANARLETRVAKRTAELRGANVRLEGEMSEHQKARHELTVSEARFEKAFGSGRCRHHHGRGRTVSRRQSDVRGAYRLQP